MKRFLLCSALAAACASAQTSAAPKTASLLDDAVAGLERANAGLSRFTLTNGLVCLLKEDRSAPVVSVQVWVGAGAVHQNDALGSGLAHAIEHMIFKGTEKRAPGDMDREISKLGGRVNAYTGLDRTVFHADVPSRAWKTALDVLADAVNASFPDAEWRNERDVILREIAMNRDDPDDVLDQLLWATAYRVHPYAWPVIGHEELFRDLRRSDLVAFCRRHYVPDNMILAVVGDVDAREAEAEIRGRFGALARRPWSPPAPAAEPLQNMPRLARKTGAYSIGRLEMAWHTTSLNDPDTPALDVLAEVVGAGRSSRLVRRLKEEQRLVFRISAFSYTPKDPGLFAVLASFDPPRETDVVAAIEREIAAWAEEGFTRAETEKAVRQILKTELSQMLTMDGQAGAYAGGEFYAADPRFPETYLRRLAAVTPEQLRAAVRKYLPREKRTLALLTPEKPAAPATAAAPPPPRAAEVVKHTLPNGVRVLVREDRRLPFLFVCAALRGGILAEAPSRVGISRLAAELLTRGTPSRSSARIAEVVDSLGGELTPFSGYNSLGIQARCFAADTETVVPLLADCLLNATFPEDEIVKQKGVQLADIEAARERPMFLAQEQLRSLLFPNHPYRWDPLGSPETLKAITREDLSNHIKKLRTGENVVLALFGDVTPEVALRLAQTHFGSIPDGKADLTVREAAAPSLPARAKRRVPREQAIVLTGFPGVSVTDPRHDALTLVENALSGLSSGLGDAIRENRGLAYFVGAYQQPGLEPGMFVLYAGTREDAVVQVEDLMAREVARIGQEGLRPEEMERARNTAIAEHELNLQDTQGVAMTCALNELYGLGGSYVFTTRERFERLTAADAQKVAVSVLSTNRAAISLVLPELPAAAAEGKP